MKKYTLISLFFVILTVFLIATSAFGASGNTFKFSDSYQEKFADPYRLGWVDLYDFGKFQINLKVNLVNGDIINQFNSDTCFDIEVGDFWSESCLTDDPMYQEGNTRASMVYSDKDFDNPYGKAYLWVKLQWNSKKLTAKIKGLTGTPDFQAPIMAFDYMDGDPGTYSPEGVDAYVTVYNDNDEDNPLLDVTFQNLYVQARVKMKYNRKWDWDLYNIKVKGQGYN
jgi:hypothetical protein